MILEQPLWSELGAFYAEVDRVSAHLSIQHEGRLNCTKGCSQCCIDDLTVFSLEAANIEANHAGMLAGGKPADQGGCAFLDDEGGCRIYEERPYVCRTQGLPLRWLVEEDGDWVEYRDICPLNEAGEPLERLADEHCWTLGTMEGRLAGLQQRFDPRMKRIPLRSLFQAAGDQPVKKAIKV